MRPQTGVDRLEARVGPNAAIQLAAALKSYDEKKARAVFDAAGVGEWIDRPPKEMIPETAVARLHDCLRLIADHNAAGEVAAEAGRRTGRYILENRIPRPARQALHLLPSQLALPLLLKAISAHAWTFAGSGVFTTADRRISIAQNPLARPRGASSPACIWHEKVFEVLFRALVAPVAVVREVECCAMGADACLFDIEISRRRRRRVH